MKIGIIIDSEKGVGGSHHHAINTLASLSEHFENCEVVPIYSETKQESAGDRLNIPLKITKLFSYFISFEKIIEKTGDFVLEIFDFEDYLLENGVEIVFFPRPNPIALCFRKLKYIVNILDLCHLEYNYFPEVYDFNENWRRDYAFNAISRKALAVVCESDHTKDLVRENYKIDKKRIFVIPFLPSVEVLPNSVRNPEILEKHGLQDKEFFLYPAQFWFHKNHRLIVEAARLMEKTDHLIKFVFCGSDFGSKAKIENLIDQFGLQDRFLVLDYVDAEDLNAFYDHALGLIYPSYFGPSNMPPLEAWKKRLPVLYNEQFKSFSEDAALPFNPDCPDSLKSKVLELIRNESLRNELVQKGEERLRHFETWNMEGYCLLHAFIEKVGRQLLA